MKSGKNNMKREKAYLAGRKRYIALAVVIILIGIALAAYSENPTFTGSQSTKESGYVVADNSLNGVMDSGKEVKIIYGYYSTSNPQRGDIVAYNYTGSGAPVIRIVKGISGDRFELVYDNTWKIKVNGEIVKNAQGVPYTLDTRAYGLLSLYEKDYKNKIPDNAYLLLGNIPSGSVDSTRFGLVDKQDIVGKVIA
jgi:signal peptidase I